MPSYFSYYDYLLKNWTEKDILSIFQDEQFKLRKELKEQLPQVAIHSEKVAMLAKLAAKAIGADEQLVYVGGIYHGF